MAETIFRKAMGDSPVIRVLEYLLEARDLDHSLTDIATGANVGWTTLHRFWPDLLATGLVKRTRTVGRATLFMLDASSKSAQQLIKLFDTLLAERGVPLAVKRR